MPRTRTFVLAAAAVIVGTMMAAAPAQAHVTVSPPEEACLQVIRDAGDSTRNDEIDARVRQEVLDLQAGKPSRSPEKPSPDAHASRRRFSK